MLFACLRVANDPDTSRCLFTSCISADNILVNIENITRFFAVYLAQILCLEHWSRLTGKLRKIRCQPRTRAPTIHGDLHGNTF